MKISAFVFSSILLCFCASLSMAGTIAVTSSASFTGGLTNSWSFGYTAGAPDLFLQSITIDLSPTDLKFDTYAGVGSTFGSLSALDISGTSFSGPGTPSLLSGYASGQALDGGTLVTFSFLDFAQGDVFQFSADVDHPDPALLVTKNCELITGWWNAAKKLQCTVDNATATTAHTLALLAAQTVGPNGMAGALVTFQFGGTNYNTASIQGAFQRLTFGDLVNGISQGEGVGAFDAKAGTNADVATPEPACVATFGAGLGLLIALAGRRRRRV
jgi:hypothetical protein